MADSIIIQRGGIPGPGADVLLPYVERAEEARDDAREYREEAYDAVEQITGLGILPLSPTTGWATASYRTVTGRVLEGTRVDGFSFSPPVTLLKGSVQRDRLDPAFSSVLPIATSTATGWLDLTINNKTGRVLSGNRVDGTSVGATGAVTENDLDPAFDRQIFRERRTLIPVQPDGIRSYEVPTGVTTHPGSGYVWTRLGDLPAQYVRGTAAVGLQFRRRLPVNMPGRRYFGTWNPSAAGAASARQVGVLSNTTGRGGVTSLPDPSGYSDGDYFLVFLVGGGSKTISQGTVYNGDCVARLGGAWVIQSAPAGASNSVIEGDWWAVSAAGTFQGVAYAVGDRIGLFGGFYYHSYSKGRPDLGQYFNNGELDASVTPSGARAGDCWQVSVAGTINGYALAVDDWLLYDGSQFYGVPGTAITATPANKPFMVMTAGTLSDWEVRRTDKSGAIYVQLQAPYQPVTRIETPAVYWTGDSMTDYVRPAAQLAFADRPFAIDGYNSAGSEEIASLYESRVRNGDPYAGRILISWLGQNTEDAWQETVDAHLRMYRMTSPRDRYYLPVLPAGRREMTFNGSRLVGRWQEPMKIGTDLTNGLVALQSVLRQMFPSRWVDARQAVIAAVAANPASFAGPDLSFPGMTEAQSAATYGIVPLSVYYDIASDGLTPNNGVFRGYWTNANLPTGGAANDYYLRSAATSGTYVGNIIANVAGTWRELAAGDRNRVVHFDGPNGGLANTAVATAARALINTLGW